MLDAQRVAEGLDGERRRRHEPRCSLWRTARERAVWLFDTNGASAARNTQRLAFSAAVLANRWPSRLSTCCVDHLKPLVPFPFKSVNRVCCPFVMQDVGLLLVQLQQQLLLLSQETNQRKRRHQRATKCWRDCRSLSARDCGKHYAVPLYLFQANFRRNPTQQKYGEPKADIYIT